MEPHWLESVTPLTLPLDQPLLSSALVLLSSLEAATLSKPAEDRPPFSTRKDTTTLPRVMLSMTTSVSGTLKSFATSVRNVVLKTVSFVALYCFELVSNTSKDASIVHAMVRLGSFVGDAVGDRVVGAALGLDVGLVGLALGLLLGAAVGTVVGCTVSTHLCGAVLEVDLPLPLPLPLPLQLDELELELEPLMLLLGAGVVAAEHDQSVLGPAALDLKVVNLWATHKNGVVLPALPSSVRQHWALATVLQYVRQEFLSAVVVLEIESPSHSPSAHLDSASTTLGVSAPTTNAATPATVHCVWTL